MISSKLNNHLTVTYFWKTFSETSDSSFFRIDFHFHFNARKIVSGAMELNLFHCKRIKSADCYLEKTKLIKLLYHERNVRKG